MEVGSEESYRSWSDAELAFFGTHGCTGDADDVAAVQEVVRGYKGFGVSGISNGIRDVLVEYARGMMVRTAVRP